MISKVYQMPGFRWNLQYDEEVQGEGAALESYFSGFEAIGEDARLLGAEENTDFIIRVFPRDASLDDLAGSPLTHFSLSRNLGFSDTTIAKTEALFNYTVVGAFDETKPVFLNISFKSGMHGSFLNKALSLLYLGVSNPFVLQVESAMTYRCFWWVFAMALVKKGIAFSHSSNLRCNGKGVVLAGTGGCGKTSVSFTMLDAFDDCAHIVDDFGTVTKSGYTIENPKPYTIHQSDVKWGYAVFNHYIEKRMTNGDRLLWKAAVKRGGNPMRRITKCALLEPGKAASQAKITTGVFFQRTATSDVLVQNISCEDFARRMVFASFRELKTLFDIMYNIQAVAHEETHIPGFDTLEKLFFSIYREAFSGADTLLIKLGPTTPPRKVLNKLSERIAYADN